MTSSHTPPSLTANPFAEDEIDLREVFGSLLRQKRLIGTFAGSALVLSTLYAFTRPPIWAGSFQIVLENQTNSPGGRLAQLSGANPILASLSGLSTGGKDSLKTEVEILKSPSVLKPIYDFVKSEKIKIGVDVSKWNYPDWVDKNVSIELVKGTSVLNLTYEDTYKPLIIPTLKQITNAYQKYSNRDSTNSIDNGLIFAEAQSKILRRKAQESYRKLDEFKFTYGIRENASNGSTKLDLQQVFTNPAQFAKPLPSGSPELPGAGEPLSDLGAINKELTRKLLFFKEADPSIKRLQKERQAILQYIDETGGGLISIAGGGSKENNREILLEFKELQRSAQRDNDASTAMQSELLSLQISKAQRRQPWDLISTPTLLDSPVAPQKRTIMAFGLLAGLVAGSGVAILFDRRTGLVFSRDELKGLLPCPQLKHLSALAPNSWHDASDLLANGPLSVSAPGPIGLVPMGNLPKYQLQRFSSELQRALGSRELLVSTDLRQTSRCATQLLLTAPGVATRTQLSQFKQKLALQGTPLAGWVLLDPDLELG